MTRTQWAQKLQARNEARRERVRAAMLPETNVETDLTGIDPLLDILFVDGLGFRSGNGQSARYTIFGKSVTSVLRWMGRQGWEFEDAARAVRAAGCPCSETTIRIQLLAGQRGERGKPARLTKAQAESLSQVA